MPPMPLHDDLTDGVALPPGDTASPAPAPLPSSLLAARGDAPAEAALIARMAQGDHAALDALYALYSDALYSLAVRMTGEPRDAEEVLQDSFVRMWKRAPAFDSSKSRPFTWAVMITRSHAIDRLRRGKVRRRTLDSLHGEAGSRPTAHSDEGLREILFHETVSRIRRGMERLTDNERRCVEAAIFDAAGSNELAALLNVPTGTAKSWLHRGLTKLRTWMNHESA
jgi:RNA polymerase sigma-70 factor (ECF subfamily)